MLVRDMQLDPAVWLALFPLSLAIHFAEEYWGGEGYVAYLSLVAEMSSIHGHFLLFAATFGKRKRVRHSVVVRARICRE